MPRPPYRSTISLAKRLERQYGFELSTDDYTSERDLQRALHVFQAATGFAGYELTRLDVARRIPSPVPLRADPGES